MRQGSQLRARQGREAEPSRASMSRGLGLRLCGSRRHGRSSARTRRRRRAWQGKKPRNMANDSQTRSWLCSAAGILNSWHLACGSDHSSKARCCIATCTSRLASQTRPTTVPASTHAAEHYYYYYDDDDDYYNNDNNSNDNTNNNTYNNDDDDSDDNPFTSWRRAARLDDVLADPLHLVLLLLQELLPVGFLDIIYIYIYRERERETYIYIYIHLERDIDIIMYICIYAYAYA